MTATVAAIAMTPVNQLFVCTGTIKCRTLHTQKGNAEESRMQSALQRCVAGKLDDPRAKFRIADARDGRGVREQAGLGHAGNGVNLEDEGLVSLREHDVNPGINLQA